MKPDKTTCVILAGLLLTGVLLGGCATHDKWDIRNILKTDWYRFLDPSQLVAKPEGEPVYNIVESLGLTDVYHERLANSRLPSEDDYLYDDSDYIVGPTDALSVTVSDLYVDGQSSVLGVEVSPIGNIELPMLDERIKADGKTADELAEIIKETYVKADIIKDPEVKVTVTARRQSQFTIVGAAQQGKYYLERPDTRLIQALAVSGGIPQMTGVRYIYVIRQRRPKAKRSTPGKATPKKKTQTVKPQPETASAPAAEPATQDAPGGTLLQRQLKEQTDTLQPQSKPADGETGFDIMQRGIETTAPAEAPPAVLPKESQLLGPPCELQKFSVTEATGPRGRSGRSEAPHKWALRNGQWVKVPLHRSLPPNVDAPSQRVATRPADAVTRKTVSVRPVSEAVAPPAPAEPKVLQPADVPTNMPRTPLAKALGNQAAEALSRQAQELQAPSVQPVRDSDDPFGWDKASGQDQIEIIAINLEELQSINARMNIIVRDNDTIYIPSPSAGEFYMYGQVGRPGVYALTGAGTTVKQAMAAGGNPTGNAWPSNCYLIRRIGRNQEQVFPLNLERIFQGADPDFYLRDADIVCVGTHVAVPFMTALRGIVPSFSMGFDYSKNFSRIGTTEEGERFKNY